VAGAPEKSHKGLKRKETERMRGGSGGGRVERETKEGVTTYAGAVKNGFAVEDLGSLANTALKNLLM